MKKAPFNIFQRITILVFSLIALLGILFITISYLATTHYHQASTQLLNKEVAAHIAKFTSPFEGGTINKQKADSVFHDAMVLSPSAEVYFLDTAGTVMAYHAPKTEIKLWTIPLANIRKYIAAGGAEYITAPDPKDPVHSKIFSAAEVHEASKKLGYIYVVLGSKSEANVMGMLLGSHISNLAVKAFVAVLVLSVLISLFYLTRIRRSFNRMVSVLQTFEAGDYTARFPVKKADELAPVSAAFNKMADLLIYNINSLTRSEQERKDFIATVSHDLRTPISVARGYAETLLLKQGQSTTTTEAKAQYVELILSKIRQVETMVKQLFELSKMEAAAFKPQTEPLVLSEIVQETVNTFQLAAAEKSISLDCTQCQYHVWVKADTAMMERVIQNLIDNAVKSTAAGGTIQSGLSVEDAHLVFRLENTGSPLADDLMHWINNNEAGLQTNRPAKAGLGLAIVQKILRLHNSCLNAAVQPNRNIFTFRLPVYHPGA